MSEREKQIRDEIEGIYRTSISGQIQGVSDSIHKRIDDLFSNIQNNDTDRKAIDSELFEELRNIKKEQTHIQININSTKKDLSETMKNLHTVAKNQDSCKFRNGEFHDSYRQDLRYVKVLNKCFSTTKSSLITISIVAFVVKAINSIPFDTIFNYLGKLVPLLK